MNFTQVHNLKEWVTDIDEKSILPSQSYYSKNREWFSSIHLQNKQNSILGSSTNNLSNYKICDVSFPIGENYSIGGYYAKKTNSSYIFIANSNGANFVYRVKDTGCDIVYHSEKCMPFSANPKNQITEWRCFEVEKKTCKNWAGIQLIFTDGIEIYSLDVEASIATNSFTTPFFDECNDDCEMIRLCVSKPYFCPKVVYLPLKQTDLGLPNKLDKKGFQFIYRFVNYDGSKSLYSDPSSFYFNKNDACFEESLSTSRCMQITLPIGNAKVAYIELAFRNNNNLQWYLAEKIPKYKEFISSLEQWYERQLSDIIQVGINKNDCTFKYTFCNDKKCLAIDPNQTNKLINLFPRSAQGLFPFGNSIAFYNYKKGNCPLPKRIADNIKITQNCNTQVACPKKYCIISVYLVIHDFWHDRNQFSYILESDFNIDGKTIYFGGLNPIGGGMESGWGQIFQDKRKNFVAQIRGDEKNNAEFFQYQLGDGTIYPVGTLNGLENSDTYGFYRAVRSENTFWYSKAEIKVEQGFKGIIEIKGHDSNDVNSSTFVEGFTNLNNYYGHIDLGPVSNTNGGMPKGEELYVDTCGKDKIDFYDRAFIIKDNAVNDLVLSNKASAIKGYVKTIGQNSTPLCGLNVYYVVPFFGNQVFGDTTDHNGFYHILIPSALNSNIELRVFGELDCNTWGLLKTDSTTDLEGEMTFKNIIIDNQSYIDNNYSKAIVQVNNCDGQPISGAKIAISNGKSQTTDAFGKSIFRIRNFRNRARLVTAIFMDSKGCFTVGCQGECNFCRPILQKQAAPCFANNGTIVELPLGTITVNTSLFKNTYGLKSGGRYGFGIIAEGKCGTLSFVNKALYLDIPKKCNNKSDNCNFAYDFSGIGLLRIEIEVIKIVRTENINPFELQWVVDKAEYIDGKIIITWQSLNDYNYKNGLKTNTVYQYLKGDRVEFISDETGNYYCDSLNYEILSPFYDVLVDGRKTSKADYFNQIIIEDDDRIGKKILPGTIIEFQRPAECEKQEIFYTICTEIRVINGIIQNPIGIFNTFDTYIVSRKLVGNINQNFEHHSPTDRWENKVSDIGNAHIVNEFEDEKRFDRNVIISDVDDFGSFGKLETTIGDAKQGGIVAINSTDDKVLLIIHEYDNNIVQKSDGLIRIQDGVAVSNTGDNIISNTQPKLSGVYGCQYEHIGSILFGDSFATWADVNNHAFVLHDYNLAKDVSLGKINNWVSRRFQEIETFNRGLLLTDPFINYNKFRFITGYNNKTGMVMLTIKQLRQGGIDNAYFIGESTNETICYQPISDKFYGHLGFTPEVYSNINLFNNEGCAFLTVLNGQVWVHPIIGKKFGSYYDVPVDTLVQYCVNIDPLSVKKFLAMELQSNMKWYILEATTNIPNFVTETFPVNVITEQTDKYNQSFMSNKNGIGGLHSGKGTQGYWLKITLIRDNKLNNQLLVFDDNKRQQFDELNNIITKVFPVSQSGFTGNL